MDTDSDGAPDTFLPGTSNFAAGLSPFPEKALTATTDAIISPCHSDPEGDHCPVVASY